jgi:hypothetical protein
MNMEAETSSETLLITIGNQVITFQVEWDSFPLLAIVTITMQGMYECVYRLSRAVMQVTAAAGKVRDGTLLYLVAWT